MARAGAGGPAGPGSEPAHEPTDTGAASAGLDYEAARDALAEVVAKLEAGNLSLEDSLALWERGESLAAICRARLDGARARVDAVLQREALQEVDDGR